MRTSSMWRAPLWLLALALFTPGCGDDETSTTDTTDTQMPDDTADVTDIADDTTADTADTTPDDPIDRLTGIWHIVNAAVGSNSCPYSVPADSGGFLVIKRRDADSGSGAFCDDAAGTSCLDRLDAMPVEIDGKDITLDYDQVWTAQGYDCTIHATGDGVLNLNGDRLDFVGTSTNEALSGTQCDEAEAAWQAMYHNSNTLDGCTVVETIGMTRYTTPAE